MRWKDYWDNKEEIWTGARLQFPLYFVVGWWVLPISGLCGLLWRLGGTKGGWKPARWALVPLVVCAATFLVDRSLWIFLAAPFMQKLNPCSYGENSWLYKRFRNDFVVRICGYAWYWSVFVLAYILSIFL